MYTPVYTKQFEKDLKLCKRRGKNLEKLKNSRMYIDCRTNARSHSS